MSPVISQVGKITPHSSAAVEFGVPVRFVRDTRRSARGRGMAVRLVDDLVVVSYLHCARPPPGAWYGFPWCRQVDILLFIWPIRAGGRPAGKRTVVTKRWS